MSDTDNGHEFELLLDRYWNLAFSEGRTKLNHGGQANTVHHKLRELFRYHQAEIAQEPDEPHRTYGDDWISDVILDLCEIPDRNSPDDFPEAMVVTPDELRRAVNRYLLPTSTQALIAAALKLAEDICKIAAGHFSAGDDYSSQCKKEACENMAEEIRKLTPPDCEQALDDMLMKVAKVACHAGQIEAQDECLGNENIHRANLRAIVDKVKKS